MPQQVPYSPSTEVDGPSRRLEAGSPAARDPVPLEGRHPLPAPKRMPTPVPSLTDVPLPGRRPRRRRVHLQGPLPAPVDDGVGLHGRRPGRVDDEPASFPAGHLVPLHRRGPRRPPVAADDGLRDPAVSFASITLSSNSTYPPSRPPGRSRRTRRRPGPPSRRRGRSSRPGSSRASPPSRPWPGAGRSPCCPGPRGRGAARPRAVPQVFPSITRGPLHGGGPRGRRAAPDLEVRGNTVTGAAPGQGREVVDEAREEPGREDRPRLREGGPGSPPCPSGTPRRSAMAGTWSSRTNVIDATDGWVTGAVVGATADAAGLVVQGNEVTGGEAGGARRQRGRAGDREGQHRRQRGQEGGPAVVNGAGAGGVVLEGTSSRTDGGRHPFRRGARDGDPSRGTGSRAAGEPASRRRDRTIDSVDGEYGTLRHRGPDPGSPRRRP